ncbi:MAG: hypothetical protein A2Y71_10090 [Bacteroidetes bacterium RBG_13_42_15]|nr:MAG: hypothetical protein A2Y71_10090 [Bacteroidetes bacterium RBG_13_42_15]
MKNLIIILLVLLIIPLSSECTRKSDKIIGIKIYEYNKDFNPLVHKWNDMGINTVFLSIDLAENMSFRQILKDNNIKVFIIFPVFYNPEALKHDSTLFAITYKGRTAKDDWVEFVCPSRSSYRNMKINEAAELVQRLRPDGLSIDFIRQFVFWEMIYPDRSAKSIDMACFCDSCTGNYCRLKNITLPDTCLTVPQKANYLLSHSSEEWNNYRCDLIASMVQGIADKVRSIQTDIKINVHIVPWRDSDFDGANIRVAAQDLQKIAPYTDYISPMCYSQMLRRDAAWIASVVTEMDMKAPGKVIPSIQVYPYYINDLFTVVDFRKCVDRALNGTSRGVVFFSWPLFEKDPARMKIRNLI